MVRNGCGVFDPTVKSLGVTESVVRTGYVNDETRTALIKSAVAVAYPSLYEGFGLPLLEAFAVGTPVVTAANSSLVEVAGDAAVLVDPRDPAAIAEGLLKMRDPALAADLRVKGRARLQLFDPAASRNGSEPSSCGPPAPRRSGRGGAAEAARPEPPGSRQRPSSSS